MSEESDRYHELERQERMRWKPLAVASAIVLCAGALLIFLAYAVIDVL